MSIRTLASIITCAAAVSSAQAEGLKSVSILPGWSIVDGTRVAGLLIELEDEWKTYWRSPGASGYPPQFDFSASQNISNIAIQWPAPNVFGTDEYATIGYKKAVVLPLIISPTQPDLDVEISLSADIGVCEDVCIPVTFTLSDIVEPTTNVRTPSLLAALANGAWSVEDMGIAGISCDLFVQQDGFGVDVKVPLGQLDQNTRIIVEYPESNVWVDNGFTKGSNASLQMRASVIAQTNTALARDAFVINLLGDGVWIQKKGCY